MCILALTHKVYSLITMEDVVVAMSSPTSPCRYGGSLEHDQSINDLKEGLGPTQMQRNLGILNGLQRKEVPQATCTQETVWFEGS